MRKICVFVGSRAHYSSIKSVMRAISRHPNLELQVILGASALVDRYGEVEDEILQDGFEPIARVYMLVEGETPITMAKSVGAGLTEFPTVLETCQPDIVVIVGDRFETLAMALAGAFMNIPVAHTMGGEVTGSIDESIRHAVTKVSHIHFPATKVAKDRIIRLGERPKDVYLVGCPRIDHVSDALSDPSNTVKLHNLPGAGDELDVNKPFILMLQHPVTSEYEDGELQIRVTLEALKEIDYPAIVMWPNADAGSEKIARGIRRWREQGLATKMRFIKHVPSEVFFCLMAKALCLVGNSSSGIREGSYIGTPTVNIGTRQSSREKALNVTSVSHEKNEIVNAVRKQIVHGPYERNCLYGDGNAGVKIAEILSECEWQVQKTINY